MIVIVDDSDTVSSGFASLFGRMGVAATGFKPEEFNGWVSTTSEPDLGAIEAFLIGDCANRESIPKLIRKRSTAAVIALSESRSLEDTISLFDCGVDDVVRKPIHVREIMARVAAIRRRVSTPDISYSAGPVRVFPDGRDPEIKGEILVLPRRERRILEYLVMNADRRVTKAQIFGAVYGIFDHNTDDNVVESHISKLRKRLRNRLGFDIIDSKRHIGYSVLKAIPTAA
ncbi:MAG: response regulator transcription factor [Hyphomicrobiaceae bacterium]